MIKNPVPWPNGARCAVAFTFDMDAESLLHLYFRDTADTRIAMSSMLRYGPEIAVPRIIDVYARYGLKQSFYVPGWCVETYPRAIELMLEHGHEVGHHGYLHEKPNTLSRDEEEENFQRAMAAIVNGIMFIVGGLMMARPGVRVDRAIELGMEKGSLELAQYAAVPLIAAMALAFVLSLAMKETYPAPKQ